MSKFNKLFFLALLCFIIALVLPLTHNSVLADSPSIGKMANDGTRIIITYWNPFAEIIGPDRSYHREGAELPLIEEALLEYNELFVYFVFAGPVQKNITYTYYYYDRKYNTTLKEFEYVLYANETRKVAALGMDYCVDEVELPFHEEEEGVKIVYRNIEFFFDHKTSKAVETTILTGYHFKIQTIWNLLQTFGICVCVGGGLAGYVSRKTQHFEFHWSYAILIPAIVFDGYLLYAEYVHYISLKELFYLFPTWAIYFIFTFVSVVIFINIFNKVKGLKIFRCAIYDTTGVEVEAHNIVMDKDEKMWLETTTIGSLIRLFSPKSRFENNFQIGKFTEREQSETLVVDSKDVQTTITSMKNAGWRFKGKKDALEGKVELVFVKASDEFEQKHVTPRWYWAAKGDTRNLLKEIWCKKIVRKKSSMVKKPWVLGVGGSLAVINLIVNFVLGSKEGMLSGTLKVFLWILFSIIIMATFSYNAVPGTIQIQPLDPHMAQSIVESQQILYKAEQDAKIIVNLKNELIDLRTEKAMDTLEEADKIATKFMRRYRSKVDYKEEES